MQASLFQPILSYFLFQIGKKIPKTTKYNHVQSTLATGKTMKDVEILSKNILRINHLSIGDKLVAKRASEKFRRIKCSTLAKLLNGFNFGESVYNWKGEGHEETKEEFKLSGMVSQSNNDTESVYSMRTDLTQKTSVTVATEALGITVKSIVLINQAETQFLLLDMREPEEYRKWHIRDSINFYHVLLN